MIRLASLAIKQIKHSVYSSFRNSAAMSSLAGFSYIEVLMAVMILAMSLIPLLSQFYIGFQGNKNAEIVTQAADLADDLIEEIKGKRFDENEFPDGPVSPSALGPDFGENPDNRATFDDIDDYNNWSKKPPQSVDGIVLTDFKDFTRSVTVKYIKLINNTWQPSTSATYYKSVVVRVSHPKINDKTVETICSHY